MTNKQVYKTLIDSITKNGKFNYRVNKETNIICSCGSDLYCDSCLFYKPGDDFSYDECDKEKINSWENAEYGTKGAC